MGVTLDINGSPYNYPEDGDKPWSDDATAAMQALANPSNTVYKGTVKALLTSTSDTDVLAASQGKVLKDVQDTQETAIGFNTAKVTYPSADSTKVGHISVTQAVDLDTMESDIGSNNSHRTGDGSDHADVASNTASVVNRSGIVEAFAGTGTPTGYLLCDGTAVSRTTYATLFTAIGTNWGVGDGSTTFNLPDLRGMFLRGTGSHGTLTMADSNAFAGASVGSSENDQFQGFKIPVPRYDAGATSSATYGEGASSGASSTTNLPVTAENFVADGTNGTPRVGDETRPVSFGVTYIIKT